MNYIHNEPVLLEDGKIEFIIPEYELHVTLPIVRRKSGSGASYAKSWDSLPEQCLKIVKVWATHYYIHNKAWTKKKLRKELERWDCYVGEDPMNARMSELLGCGLITMEKQNVKDSPRHSTQAPEYRLALGKTVKLLHNKNRL